MRETLETYYFIIVFISFLYIFFKVGINKLSFIIVLIFWGGLFAFIGTTFFNLYKIFVVAYCLFLFGDKVFKRFNSHEKYINAFFAFFTISFWISYFYNGGGITTILSQYAFKFGLAFLIYHGFKDVVYNTGKKEYLKYLLLQILYVQVVLSVIKILLFGFAFEQHVGSMAFGGAGVAVVMPILGLIFYWLIHKGKLTLRDWLIVSSFLLIGLASGKRAPVILFPLFALLLVGYGRGKLLFNLSNIVIILPLALFLFYLGARVTPSLNPDNKVGGRFDFEHIINYSIEYNFGTSDQTIIFSENYKTESRGGGLVLLFNPQRLGLSGIKEFLFGKGLYEVAVKEKGKLILGDEYDIEHQGGIGTPARLLFTLGYVGLVSMFLFSVVVINTIYNRRLKLVVFLFYFWEFFFYGNQVIFNHASIIVVCFIIFNSNSVGKAQLNGKITLYTQ